MAVSRMNPYVIETYNSKPFLWAIVNNEKTKIDVDKWDYFERYYHYLGKRNSFEYTKLLQFVRIVKDESNNKFVLAYRNKEAESIWHMFQMRWHYHHHYFKDPKLIIIEQMFIDAFAAANLDITNKTDGPCQIIHLLQANPAANSLYNRIINQDMYQVITNSNIYQIALFATDNFNDIKTAIVALEDEIKSKFENENIYLSIIKFDYGHGNMDPFTDNAIPFYSENNPSVLLIDPLFDLPIRRPTCFQEIQITCVSKIPLEEEVQQEISNFYNEKIEPYCATYQIIVIENKTEQQLLEDDANQQGILIKKIRRWIKHTMQIEATVLKSIIPSYSIKTNLDWEIYAIASAIAITPLFLQREFSVVNGFGYLSCMLCGSDIAPSGQLYCPDKPDIGQS
uniref:Uncharacterized protein n=1 Tax=Strigamia maritima TaxID=126957 RepID=T1JJR9_STRMM